jgi:hypothetical protein
LRTCTIRPPKRAAKPSRCRASRTSRSVSMAAAY